MYIIAIGHLSRCDIWLAFRIPVTHIQTHTHTHTHTHAHTHTLTQARTHAHSLTQAHAHTHTRVHARTHARTHTHTHTHTHTFSIFFCTESSKFSYMPGKIYEYAYESNSRTTIPGSTEELAGLQMRANVQLAVASACEMAIKVKPVDNFLLPVTLRFHTNLHINHHLFYHHRCMWMYCHVNVLVRRPISLHIPMFYCNHYVNTWQYSYLILSYLKSN